MSVIGRQVGTGVILSGRKVLISPVALRHPARSPMYIHVKLTWEQVKSSPSIDLHKQTSSKTESKDASNDTHLRSTREVTGYHIKATDGEIGHLEDFLFDDEAWEIRYAIVDTKNWWPGKKVLLKPQWIKRVSWPEREIYADMSCESIRKSPKWDPDLPVSREYELRLHQHYGSAPYWATEK